MKKAIFIFLIFLATSCTKDELEDTSLDGEWILTNVSCFCYFEDDHDFSTSSIIFNTDENQATIENKGETHLMESGVYGYASKNEQISFGNNRWYIFSVEGSKLTLIYVDEPGLADDEISYTYERSN